MVYRRYPYLHRTYYHADPKHSKEKDISLRNERPDSLKEKPFKDIKTLNDIPMPNEKESIRNQDVSMASGSERSSPEERGLKFYLNKLLTSKLNLEDLIILGIIIVLLYEGRKDDMLLVVLIYLLI